MRGGCQVWNLNTECLIKKASSLWLLWILSRVQSYWFLTKETKKKKNRRKKKRKLGLKVSLWVSECLSALLHTSRPHIFQMCWIGQEDPSAPLSPHTHTYPHHWLSLPSSNISDPLKTPKWIGTTSQKASEPRGSQRALPSAHLWDKTSVLFKKGNKPNSNDKDQKPTGEMRRLSHAEGITVLSEG